MEDTRVTKDVLAAARMVVTEGFGEGRPAHGFFIIVGNTNEILAQEDDDSAEPDIKKCKYGAFKVYADRRSQGLWIGDCLDKRKRNFCNLVFEDGAIIVDRQTGQVCCGGFFVKDIASGIGSGGTRMQAASAMATQAGGCYVVLATQTICGSIETPVPASANLMVFSDHREPNDVPVHVPEFEQWLHPLKFDADLRRHNEDFVEGTRMWILDEVEAWRIDPNGSPCKALLAGPDFGKTAIAAHLYEKLREKKRLLAIHMLEWSHSVNCNPRRMIASIAYQIAQEVPAFKDALRKLRKAEGGTKAYSLRQTARELAHCLLFNPLIEITNENKFPPSRDGDGRYIIIIDALDEAEHGAKNDLIDLVALDFPSKLPPWVAVLVTSKAEVDINERLKALHPTVLDDEAYKRNCDDDVDTYLEKIVAPKFTDDRGLADVMEKIKIKSEGNFLYLHHVRVMLKSGEKIDELPIGLASLYRKRLEVMLGDDGLGDENSQTRRVVEAIVAAQEPIHVQNELPGLSGVPEGEVQKRVIMLSQLLHFCDGDRKYICFQKSIVDWLTRNKSISDHSGFIVNRSAAHRRLALACAVPLMRLLRKEAGRFQSNAHAVAALEQIVKTHRSVVHNSHQPQASYEYALKWSVTHLVVSGGDIFKDASLSLLCSLRFLIERAQQIDTLIADVALFLPKTKFLHRALVQAQTHLQPICPQWLAEELWQRLLLPAKAYRVSELYRLAVDARKMARANLIFSARGACLTPADSSLHCVFHGHENIVNAATAFNASGHTWVATCSNDATVRIWDPMKGGNAFHILKGHSDFVSGVTAFNDADGRTRVASFSKDKTVRIWNPIKGGEAIRVLNGHQSQINGLAVCPDNRWLASCSNDMTVRIWDVMEDGDASSCVLQGHKRVVSGVAFVKDNGLTSVASCSFDRTVRIWHAIKDGKPMPQNTLPDGNGVQVLTGHKDFINSVTAFKCANKKTWVASCSDDLTVRIWDPINDSSATRVLSGHSDSVTDVTAFVDQEYTWVVASCSDTTICIWGHSRVEHRLVRKDLKGHTKKITGVTTFLADETTWVASGSHDNTVCIWDAINRTTSDRVLEGHLGEINDVTAFKDTKRHAWVASCSTDMTVRIWDSTRFGQEVRRLEDDSGKVDFVTREGHSSKVNCLTAFVDTAGHTWVVSCSDDKTVRIWEAMKGDLKARVLKDHNYCVCGVAAFVDAMGCTRLATCSKKEIRIWVDPHLDMDAFSQKPRLLEDHLAYVNAVTAFRDASGKTYLASCSKDMTVRIWDAMNGDKPVHVLKGHSKCVNGVTAFVDAKSNPWIASCSQDKTVRIWDVNRGTAEHVLNDHSGEVNAVTTFVDSESRTWVVSGSNDKTGRVWDAIEGGRAKYVLKGHSEPITGVTCVDAQSGNACLASCSNDSTVGIWVASCSNDSTVRIWDAINGGKAFFVIPLDNPPTAILAVWTAPARAGDVGEATTILAIGHKNGQVTFWDHTQSASTETSCCFQ